LPPEVLKIINEGIKNESPVKIDYLCKADNLVGIVNLSQDFIIANHVFEHLDNPLKALIEWHRVLKGGGILFLTVPDKRRTFDK
jgi:predicted SAM-dependent methyltransferase